MDESEIRLQAIETLQRRGWKLGEESKQQEISAILNELSIHQVELELQNEELRRAQVELEISRQRYFELYNLAPIGYLTFDRQGQILEVNLHAAELLGKPVTQLRGRALSSILSGEAIVVFLRHLNAVTSSSLPQQCRLSLPKSAGTLIYLELRSLPWLDEAGQIVGARTVMQDVSGRVKAEMEAHAFRERMNIFVTELRTKNEALQSAAELLRLRNQDLAQMAFATSHDLKAPLRTVASYTKHLVNAYRDQLDEDGHRLVSHIMRGLRQMDQVIEGLVSYGRLGSEGNPLVDLDLSQVFNDARRALKGDILESGAMITNDALPFVHGDGQQLKLLLQNLLDNSIKYRGHKSPLIHLSVRDSEKAGYYQFSLRDNGIGFDPKHAERAFRMFKRLNTYVEGTGIGLAQCQRIVQNHGGEIWVATQPNLGATFHFTLPKASFEFV